MAPLRTPGPIRETPGRRDTTAACCRRRGRGCRSPRADRRSVRRGNSRTPSCTAGTRSIPARPRCRATPPPSSGNPRSRAALSLGARLARFDQHTLVVLRLGMALDPRDDAPAFRCGDPRVVGRCQPGARGMPEQHVTLTEQPLGPRCVQDRAISWSTITGPFHCGKASRFLIRALEQRLDRSSSLDIPRSARSSWDSADSDCCVTGYASGVGSVLRVDREPSAGSRWAAWSARMVHCL